MTRRDVLRMAAVAMQPRVPESRPAPGKLLVAGRELLDPNFIHTVVLLVTYDEKGAMGLVLNRPSRLKISEVLDWQAAKARAEVTWFGGPVQRTGVLALVRTTAKPPDARPVLADISLVSNRPFLEKMLPGASADRLRIYLGYSGWGAGQLDMELRIGSWRVMRTDSATVFDPDTSSLWQRLIRRTEVRVA